MLRGIQSCIQRESKSPDGLEGEVHTEYLKRAKAEGGLGFKTDFQVPPLRRASLEGMSRPALRRLKRDMQATIFGAGGAGVATELLLPYIELLRNEIVLPQVGVRTLAGLVGNVVIPRLDAPATAYSVSEIGLLTASQQVLSQIALTPKRVGATETYSKQLLIQSSPDIEALIRDDLFQVIGLLWDYYGLAGSGAASQPTGIFNTPGIQSITFGATPTYIKMVAMETALRQLNVRGPLAYVSTPATKGSLKTVAEALTGATTIGGSQTAIWKGMGEGNGEVNGYTAIDSNQVPNNQVVLGDWSQLIWGMWGGLDVVVDYYTKAANGEIVLTINTWGDFALRHPQAFVVSTDSGAQ